MADPKDIVNKNSVSEKLFSSATRAVHASGELLKDTGDVKRAIAEFGAIGGKIGETSAALTNSVLSLSDNLRTYQKSIASAVFSSGEFSIAQKNSQEVLDSFTKQLGETAKFTGQSFQEISENVSKLMKTSIDMGVGIRGAGTEIEKSTAIFQDYTRMVMVARNVGIDLNDATAASKSLFKDQGITLRETTGAFAALQAAVKDTGATTEQGLSVLTRMGEAYKFLEFDSTKAAMAIGQMATFAKQTPGVYKSSQQAIESYSTAIQSVAGLQQDMAQSMFFGTASGKGTGFEAMMSFMEEDPAEALKSVIESTKKTMGGKIFTADEAKAGGAYEQSTFMAQAKFIGDKMGMKTPEAMKFMNFMASGMQGDTKAQAKAEEILEAKRKVMSGDVAQTADAIGDETYRNKMLTFNERMSTHLAGIRTSTLTLADDIVQGMSGMVDLVTGLGKSGIEELRGPKMTEAIKGLAGSIPGKGKINVDTSQVTRPDWVTSANENYQRLQSSTERTQQQLSEARTSTMKLSDEVTKKIFPPPTTPSPTPTPSVNKPEDKFSSLGSLNMMGVGQEQRLREQQWKTTLGLFGASGGKPSYLPNLGEGGFSNVVGGNVGGPSSGKEMFDTKTGIGVHTRGINVPTTTTNTVDVLQQSQQQRLTELKKYADSLGNMSSGKLEDQADSPAQRQALASISEYVKTYNTQMSQGIDIIQASQEGVLKAQKLAGGNLAEVIKQALPGAGSDLSRSLATMNDVLYWNSEDLAVGSLPQTTTSRTASNRIDNLKFGAGIGGSKKTSLYEGLGQGAQGGVNAIPQVGFQMPSIASMTGEVLRQVKEEKTIKGDKPIVVESHITVNLDSKVVAKAIAQQDVFQDAVRQSTQNEVGKDYANHGNRGRA